MPVIQLAVLVVLATLAGESFAQVTGRAVLHGHRSPKGRSGEKRRNICNDPIFRKTTLKLLKHEPAIGLFSDLKNHTKFEASGIEIANGYFWVIFDSSYSLGRVDLNFSFGGQGNELFGELGDDSGFEDLTYVPSRDTWLVHREGVETEGGSEVSTLELQVVAEQHAYRVIKACTVEFKPDPRYPNKGFEGIHYFEGSDGTEYLMALCEGNFCTGGKRGKEPGNGRLVIASFYEDADSCEWKTVKVLEVPPEANFIDYSGINIRGDKVAIVSQESAAVWIGKFDFSVLDFVDKGSVFHFPRDRDCNIAFCNIEGIAFMDDSRIVVASDKAKATQPYACTLTDQAIQVFAIPGLKEDDEEGDEAEYMEL